MKRIIVIILAVALGLEAMAQSKVIPDTLNSAILGREVPLNVYLPEGFSDEGTEHYPVVYLLHGLSDNHDTWVNWGGIKTVADELIECGEAVPMVIIMPCAGGQDIHNVQNGYFNMPDCNYEDFFFKELIPGIEQKYHCGGSKWERAIMGLSMGGGGSVVYCQHHPELFSSCFAMSPWLDNDLNQVECPKDKSDKLYIVGKAVANNSAIKFLDKAKPETLEKLRTVKWFVDCGDDDFLLQLSMDFHMKMREKGIKNELRIRNGVHNWEYWHLSLRQSLPFASRNFGE